MGRVSRYKKIRSVDPFSKQRGGNVNYNTIGVWGLGVASVKTKKRSLTAQRLYEAKINNNTKKNIKHQQQQQSNTKPNNGNQNNRKESKFGSSSYHHHSSDEQPLGDEFDLKNLTGSIKKQKSPLEEFMLHSDNPNTTATTISGLESSGIKRNQGNIPQVETTVESTTDDVIISKALQREDDKMMKKLEQQVQQKHQKATSTGSKLLAVIDVTKTKNEKGEGNNGEKNNENSDGTMIRRKDGESMKDYRTRRQHEMKLLTSTSKVQMKRNLDKVARKKEFLTNKKKKRKNNKFLSTSAGNNNDDDDDDNYDDNFDNDSNNDTEINRTGPAFEQQVERPPIFRQLPRGAIEKKKNNNSVKTSTTKLSSSSTGSLTTKKQHQTASANEMEKLRLQVQAQYAMIRSQRHSTNKNHAKNRSSNNVTSSSNGRIQYPGFLE
jgi:hypothetical protein